ncbi:MAG: tetratricopeptide repeat protein [Candidatus Omnitrophota bacterium]
MAQYMNFYLKFSRYKKFFQLFLIVLLCFIIYIPSLRNGFIWDDETNLYENPCIQKAEGLKLIWFTNETYQYYPVVFTTFWLEHKLWGLNPFGYHTINLILHLFNALLLFWIALKLYPRLAFVLALLFAVHPIQVETVAWITERKNLLSLFFFLLTILAYLRFDRTRRIRDYLLTVIMFVFALFSKPIAVCFIFFPFLYKWWQDGKITWREIRLSAVFVITGLLNAGYTLYLEYYNVGAQGRAFDLTFLERFILAGRILIFYIYKLLFPFNFMFFYPRWIVNARVWWQWLFPFSVMLVLGVFVYYRKKIGRGTLALFIFYIISIFPVLGFINVYGMNFSWVADHFSYLSVPVLLLLFCACICCLLDRLRASFPRLCSLPYRILSTGLFIFAINYMCFKSAELARNYKDSTTLWSNLIRENPKAWVAYANLAAIYINIGKTEEALVLYKKAMALNPNFESAIVLYNNLGNLSIKTGKNKEALALYKKAIAINPDSKSNVLSYYNLGNAYYAIERKADAIKAYEKAIQLSPKYLGAFNNLASVYVDVGKIDKAIELWNEAIQINPAFAIAQFNLAVFYFQRKQYNLAIKHCDKVTELGDKVDPKFLLLLKPYRK